MKQVSQNIITTVWLHLYDIPVVVRLIKVGSRMVGPRSLRKVGMKNYCLVDMEFQVWNIKKVLGMAGGDGCITMWMYFVPLNYTLENG